MRYIFIHGLGQNSSSWEETISYMEEMTNISHPDLFDLLKDKESTYNNLYLAFSEYIEESSEPSHPYWTFSGSSPCIELYY